MCWLLVRRFLVKVQPVALQLLQTFLPPDQLATLNLQTLQLSSESFLSDDLRESFSDLVDQRVADYFDVPVGTVKAARLMLISNS
ncbi:MAG: Rpn family recombination-promoting nuclease/putative transposase [Saprospiraceae bacterium]